MTASISGLLKIVIFLIIGWGFRRLGVLKDRDVEGIKKIILNLAIPAVLFLSFSRLDFNIGFIPVIASVFLINLLLFRFGVLLYRLSGSRHRILPLLLSTFNFALIGIPLYEAVFGIDNLHHYTMFGVGNEIFVWFVFYFMFRRFLTKGKAERRINIGFVKSPIVWGILLGCTAGILGIDPAAGENVFLKGLYDTLFSASKITTPLILLFIGYNISVRTDHLKQTAVLVLIRLSSALAFGYAFKILVIDRFVDGSVYYNAAFFLLISLPAIFALPILAAEYLDDDETAVLNNTIVLHTVVTIVIFAVYSVWTLRMI